MKRAYSQQNEKKFYNSNMNSAKESNGNFSLIKNTMNDRNTNNNKVKVNHLNINTLHTNNSNFNSNTKQTDISRKISKDKYTIPHKTKVLTNQTKITLSRNNSLDRLKIVNNNYYSENNSKILNTKVNSNLNTRDLIKNLKPINKINYTQSHKPKIINDNLHRINRNININILSDKNKEENLNKFSNIDRSLNKKFTKPSDKFQRVKYSDPFASSKKHKTNFGYVYSAGGIPSRIEHGSVNMRLKWDIEPKNLDYDPILIVCFEGLMEVEHPYKFAARQCVREMLQSTGAREKILPVLVKIVNPLRNALGINNDGMFGDSLDITKILSDVVKDSLNPYLHFFLQNINKKAFSIKFKEKVFDFLRVLERNGGEFALKEIKKKIPTYVSLL